MGEILQKKIIKKYVDGGTEGVGDIRSANRGAAGVSADQ